MSAPQVTNDASQLSLSYYEDLWQDLRVESPHDVATVDAQHVGYRALAVQAFAAAVNQAHALSTASGCSWRVTHVECLCPHAFPLAKPRRVKGGTAEPDTAAESSQPSTMRLSLLARITLTCESPDAAASEGGGNDRR